MAIAAAQRPWDAGDHLVVTWNAVDWDLRHRKSSLVIRSLLAIWIVVIVVVLCYSGRWWGLVFVLPLILDLYLLRRILVADSSQ
jgi:1,4-dihydroxy-2-naphthoate octaprenyltransferase